MRILVIGGTRYIGRHFTPKGNCREACAKTIPSKGNCREA